MADTQLYEVERILDKKVLPGRKVIYLVGWKGFSSEYDSWEPIKNLKSCQKLIALYNSNGAATVSELLDLQNKAAAKSPEKTGHNKKAISQPKVRKSLDSHKNRLKLKANQQKVFKLRNSTGSSPIKNKKGPLKKGTPVFYKKLRIHGRDEQLNNESNPANVTSALAVDTFVKKRAENDTKKSIDCSFKKASDHIIKKGVDSVTVVKKKGADSATKKGLEHEVKKASDNAANKILDLFSKKGAEDIAKKKENVKKGKSKLGKPSEQADSSSSHVSKKKSKLKRSCEEKQDSKGPDGPSKVKKSKVTAVEAPSVSKVEEKKNEENDSDDESVLYCLNDSNDNGTAKAENEFNKKSKDLKKEAKKVSTLSLSSSTITVITGTGPAIKPGHSKKNGGKGKKTVLQMSSKSKKVPAAKKDLLRSASPPPVFTAVKKVIDDGPSSVPSKPSENSMPHPVSPEASETYLADVPSLYPVPNEESAVSTVERETLSPNSMSFKSFLSNLSPVYPPQKGGKKAKGQGGGLQQFAEGLLGASLAGSTVGREPVERRTSVRSTECAFRYKQIVVKKCFRYTQIWLNTQTVMQNALNPQAIQELVSALNSAKYDDSHLVLFSSLGSVFCSGTDLHFLVSGDRRMAARQMADSIREVTKTFITFPKPIIAAVSGAAVGLGVSLLALCDIVYASDKASFHLPYSQLSQTPEGCSSFTLPLYLGLPSANELLFGGRKITAMEAYQLGLVSQVFWPTLMMQEVIPRAQNMATCSAKALEATKLLVRSHHRTKMELSNETECNLLLERWSSVDCQRAVEVYLSNEKNLSF